MSVYYINTGKYIAFCIMTYILRIIRTAYNQKQRENRRERVQCMSEHIAVDSKK